jgi:hypothetical protein
LVDIYEVLSVNVGLGYTILILAVLTALSAYAMQIISKGKKFIEDSKVCKKPVTLEEDYKVENKPLLVEISLRINVF